jgi:hypothetical protein
VACGVFGRLNPRGVPDFTLGNASDGRCLTKFLQ